MKNFFRHWHYGIKAKVIDGALVADIDTSTEPMLVRLDLTRLQSVGFEVQIKNNVYELMLVGVGAPAATTSLAKFEVREAADEAAACLKCALLRGTRRSLFGPALRTTLGILVALLIAMLGVIVINGGSIGSATGVNAQSVEASLMGAAPAAVPVLHEPGVPQSADQFLNATPAQ